MLIDHDLSLLVIDTLGKQAVDENAAVACFYFYFATQEEQSQAEILGSVLKQVAAGLNKVHQIVKAFRDRRRVICGQRLGLAKIVEFLQDIISQRTFICMSGKPAGEALSFTQPNPPEFPRHANISDREATYPG